MNRKNIDNLQQRLDKIRQQFLPGVSMLMPQEDGTFRLICGTWNGTSGNGGTRQETIHATEAEGRAAYNRFIQAHPVPNGYDPCLIIIDV